MKKRDLWIVGGVLLAALGVWLIAGFLVGGKANEVRVYLDGELYVVLPLDEDNELVVSGENGVCNVIEVCAGRVRMKQSTCPNQTCVGCGWRSAEEAALLPDMRWIVCLPNRVSVELAGH